MAVVATRGLTKVFRAGLPPAVDSVDLESREGEFLVLLGPSGSGKSTVLRMIAGLEEPTSGEISIGGRVVNGLSARERGIAMVFQSYALYPHLTVARNIAFPLRARGVPKALQREKVERAAATFRIGHLLDRRPRELSGGERQRVAIARAIVRDPSVFLLDEPLSNLDAKLRASAREELEKFQKELGVTTIYVTHDQVEAMAMGDRIVVLSEGRVRQIGAPAEVYDDPADTFVATFLGSPPMNLLESGDTLLGFRPEHLRLSRGRPASDGDLHLTVAIENVEYLGVDRLVYGRLEGAFSDAAVVARLPASEPPPAEGTSRQFEVVRGDLRRFDRATGKRLAGDRR
jgi:multiple sugar transport system ATP-binding protein